ncbi:MAG TPA: hypothetical protein VEC36_08050 [Patescibacteria group bacterium]|nr:hypothetical protein [Patescibacteria group bacterium]
MKNILIALSWAVLLGLSTGCTAPTDVEAIRTKVSENPPGENTIAIRFATQFVDFGYVKNAVSSQIELPIYNFSWIDTVEVKTLTLTSGKDIFKAVATGGLPIQLLGGQRTTPIKKVYVQFYPKETGEYFDTLYVNGDRKNFVILRGVSGPGDADTSVRINDIYFGVCPVGQSVERTTEVFNLESKPLYLRIEELPRDETPFLILSKHGEYIIPPGTSKSFTVAFTPRATEDYSSVMRFYIKGASGHLNGAFYVSGRGTP